MIRQALLQLSVLIFPIFHQPVLAQGQWIVEKQQTYTLHYTLADKAFMPEYKTYFDNGKNGIEAFFRNRFAREFSIYVHPSRASLDSTWQKDWEMPDFKSECWMVASGVAEKIDIISPIKWDSIACEHSWQDPLKTQRLINHELVHVYHGQKNRSHDFSDINGLDWFVEGLAVYASGQCDDERINAVKRMLAENAAPQKLNEFWSGKLKYGLSGTIVMYIDRFYGRETLTGLLEFNDVNDLLRKLDTSEESLIAAWKDFMKEIQQNP
jgi:hypothetical protein